ncbi:MAG TPA: ATP-binding protein [Phycisphaerae bacterium]|nr:ATP-binding protein [Phycisphaerae bacterium]
MCTVLVWLRLHRRGTRSVTGRWSAGETGNLAAGLVHEIRNPLSTLKVNLDLLMEDWAEAQQREDPDLPRRSLVRLESVRSEAARLGNTLDAFMRLVSHHELNLSKTDLNDVVEHLVDFFAPQMVNNNIRLRVSLVPEPLPCKLDGDLIRQALVNLVLNAQQAMPDGGELIIRSARDQGNVARLDVADTGCGIQPEDIDRIWQPYYSTKKGGSGLGLSMARRIVLEHDGSIGVSSQPGRGTSFTIRLPLADRT